MSITRGLTHTCRHDSVSALLCFHLTRQGRQELSLIPKPTMSKWDLERKRAGVTSPEYFAQHECCLLQHISFVKKIKAE